MSNFVDWPQNSKPRPNISRWNSIIDHMDLIDILNSPSDQQQAEGFNGDYVVYMDRYRNIIPMHWVARMSRGEGILGGKLAQTLDLTSVCLSSQFKNSWMDNISCLILEKKHIELFNNSINLVALQKLVLFGENCDRDVIGKLVAMPWLSQLESISLINTNIAVEDLDQFFESTPSLLNFDFVGNVRALSACDLDHILEWPGIERFKHLVLEFGEEGLDQFFLKKLLMAPQLSMLREFGLVGFEFGEEFTLCLDESFFWSNLEGIELESDEQYVKQLLGKLFSSPRRVFKKHHAQLKYIYLNGNPLDASLLKTILNCGLLDELKALYLAECGLDTQALKVLARAPAMGSVETLDLSRNFITIESIRAFVKFGNFQNITTLCLSSCSLSHNKLILFFNSKFTYNIKHLDLTANPLGAVFLNDIFGSMEQWPALRHLWLDRTQIGDEGLGVLNLSLDHLGLGYNGITSAGLNQFLSSSNLRSLRSFDLRSNEIGDGGAALLDGTLPNLQRLDLTECNLGDSGVAALVSSAQPSMLGTLDLTLNGITANGLKKLLNCKELSQLHTLGLSGNPLGETAVDLLLSESVSDNLEVLCIDSHHMGESLFELLAERFILVDQNAISIA